MEGFIGIVLFFGAFIIFGLIKSHLDDFSVQQQKKAQEYEISCKKKKNPFRVKLVEKIEGEGKKAFPVKEIKAIGFLPIETVAHTAFYTFVVDKTGEKSEPVLSSLQVFQDPKTHFFQHKVDGGILTGDHMLSDWASIGSVLPDILVPPYGGKRKLAALLFVVDKNELRGTINHSVSEKHPGVLKRFELLFSLDFPHKGYLEAAKIEDQAKVLILKLGLAVALSDGTLHNSEGELLKSWVIKQLEGKSKKKREEAKKKFNAAMKDGYMSIKNGELSAASLAEDLDALDSVSSKYEAIELCYSVLAADGIADTSELHTIHEIAELLHLDLDGDEIVKIRDNMLVNLKIDISAKADAGAVLGIDPTMSSGEINDHLRKEFNKWNNRLNTLPEGEERNNAQRMLNLIADARKKYG